MLVSSAALPPRMDPSASRREGCLVDSPSQIEDDCKETRIKTANVATVILEFVPPIVIDYWCWCLDSCCCAPRVGKLLDYQL